MSYLSQFNYQILGPSNGPKWVFLHGLMGYALNWRKITSHFEKEKQILAYDQRGHGRSFQPLTGYAPEDYADDLHIIIDELGWDQITLVGHSMGGRNAINFAYRFSDRVRALVLEDIGPGAAPNSAQKYIDLVNMIPTPFDTKLAAKEYFLNEFPQQAKGWNKPEMLGQYLYSNIIETETKKATWRFSKEAIFLSITQGRSKDYWHEYEELKMPTLIIRGENSNDLSQENYKTMLKKNANSRGVVIANAGHWVHTDNSNAFIEALTNFDNSLRNR